MPILNAILFTLCWTLLFIVFGCASEPSHKSKYLNTQYEECVPDSEDDTKFNCPLPKSDPIEFSDEKVDKE